MKGETRILEKILPWLKAKKEEYEKRGYIPTLELLIADLESSQTEYE